VTDLDPTASRWIEAVTTGGLGTELDAIYAEASRRIAERGPACWASGRCCNFDSYGHRLYVTGIEAAHTVAQWNASRAPLLSEQVEAAQSAGGCPFQRLNLCDAHEIKPLGCRLFFCDRTATEWQTDLLEELHARVRALHAGDIPYEYAEWRYMLKRFAV
jgi:Fe-S-cluster containining protein